MVRSYFTGAGNDTALPSYASSRALSPAASTCVASSSTPATPEPETAWYVEAISRTSPAASCSGLSTGIAAIVVQLGVAMMPRPAATTPAIASGLTSETTSGMAGSLRNALELSTTITPASTNFGTSAREVVAPAEKSAMSRPDGSAVSASSTTTSLPANGSTLPADRAEAKKRIWSTAK